MESTLKVLDQIVNISQFENNIEIKLNDEVVRVTLLRDDVFRVWMEPKGIFDDPTSGKIIAKTEKDYINTYGIVTASLTEEDEYYKVATSSVVIRLYKDNFRFEVYRSDNKTRVFGEKEPLKYREGLTLQTLDTDVNEYFYGGGVQNGYFSHKNKKITIANKISHWNDGSVSNPAPFFMSNGGYGAFRNTFKPGEYEFNQIATMSHNEERFDCFYFVGQTLGDILERYTELTGRPTLIPRWGFSAGDANCYKETMDALKIANDYVEHDIPRGWILPNDGYGCGYTDLKGFINKAEEIGFKVGLWTENSVDKIAQEVGEFGSRVVKTDVAWVGPGYEFALDGVKTSFDGIENNSDSRGYVWTCCGWAGTQRYSAVWTGDQSGDWEYIRFHIPTYIGSGLSGMPYIGSDIDGIFGGFAETQVRDIQWKAFTPITINMSGWAKNNKQPWVWGEPYTSYNRTYLKLKQRLTPYMYTYAQKSYDNGSPIMRGMLWDYPQDKFTLGKNTEYQFMLGDYFLVAPVYEDAEVRHGIYLPDEKQVWIDYITGEKYLGGKVINNFKAPLWKLPVFVKGGAIIPMYPQGSYDGEVMPNDENPITFDIYPSGATTFELYEDDGNTKEHRTGSYAKTLISVEGPECGVGEVIVIVHPTEGNYSGIIESRRNEFIIHSNVNPKTINLNVGGKSIVLDEVDSNEYDNSVNCWYFDSEKVGGIVCIKTESISIRNEVNLEIKEFSNALEDIDTSNLVKPEVVSNIEVYDITDTSMALRWDEVEDATQYDLLMDGMVYTNVTNPYIRKGLDFTTTYDYQVRAVNEVITSEWSNIISGTTLESSLKDVVPEEEMTAWASSYQEGSEPENAVNQDMSSVWHSKWGENGIPATYIITMKNAYNIEKFEYLTRRQGGNGNITKYNLSISLDGVNYKDLVKEGTWLDEGSANMVIFENPVIAKYIKIEALAGNGNYAAASIFRPYRVKGTDKVILGDYTGTGNVTENDLTFVKNYIGVKKGDNDWEYVSKCDINYNDEIDIYDVAFVASQLGEDIVTNEGEVAGKLKFVPEKDYVKAGEEFEVNVIGEGLKDVYALQATLNLDLNKYEQANCTGRCGKEVLARRTELTDGMVNCSTPKDHDEDLDIIVALTNIGRGISINSDGILATIKLKAKVDTKVSLECGESTILIGSNLRSIDAK